MIKAVAKISTGTNGHRYSGKDAWVLVAAISRQGWGSRAEFIARYRYRALPGDQPVWSGEVRLLDPPTVGEYMRIETPFGILDPIFPLYSRVFGMPKIKPS